MAKKMLRQPGNVPGWRRVGLLLSCAHMLDAPFIAEESA